MGERESERGRERERERRKRDRERERERALKGVFKSIVFESKTFLETNLDCPKINKKKERTEKKKEIKSFQHGLTKKISFHFT